jgi:nucleotide-binding universal stress UspA family protein
MAQAAVMAFERILVATDFSDDANGALEVARKLAQRLDAELIVLHVAEKLGVIPGSGLAEEERETATKALAAIVDELRAKDVRVRSVLRPGLPLDEILAAATEEGADLLVVGAAGHSSLADVLLGTIAEQVVRRAPCPVLTVRHPDRQAASAT